MFERIIEFSASKIYVDKKDEHPIPAKFNLPDWYKNLKYLKSDENVKGCIPFLDSMTAGYILKTPQDFYIKHNFENENKVKDTSFACPMRKDKYLDIAQINLTKQGPGESHPSEQMKGSPHLAKNNDQAFLKFLNPWRIKTPAGYSCLFVPPLNNSDDRFSIIPGIVDTDTYSREVNFPFTINGDKYKKFETTIHKGTSYVQVIPFKRDDWKMKMVGKDAKSLIAENFGLDLTFMHRYKTKFWSKKTWR